MSEITAPTPLKTDRLDADPDPKHVSYKVLGLLSWGILIFCLIGSFVTPRLVLGAARWLSIYMLLRFIVLASWYLVGLVKIRGVERQVRTDPARKISNPGIAGFEPVHHLVVIPNFNEPPDVLRRTLQSLSVQAEARNSITVVLAMEEREPGARGKAASLVEQYAGSFFRLLVTIHPAGIPGEAPGKGVNDSWAVRSARKELVDNLGVSSDRVVVTVADSDSILHPAYFSELTRQFAFDVHRYSLVWQPPIFLDNDIWSTHAVIRLMTFFSTAISAGDYFNSWEAGSPYSTYSISLKLLEEINYWDPTVIAEDVNIFSRAFFKKGGEVFIRRIFLPVHGNPVFGVNLWHSIGIFYAQKVRQGWGGAEIGYLLQKWNVPPGAPFLQKLGRLLKLFHDHLFFSTAGFVVALGTLLSILLDHSAVITLPPNSVNPLLFTFLNLLGGSALVVTWFGERLRLGRGRVDWSLKTLAGEVIAWMIFPLLFFLLMNLPGLQAQTGMLLGQPFYFNRTPKRLDSKMGE